MPETAATDPTTTPTPSTPVSTPAAVPAAPATSAPASASSTSQRPTNVRELASLMEQLDDTSAATSPERPAAASAVPASTTPAATPAPSGVPSTPPPQGPIPFDVHQRTLQNTRDKTRAEVQAEFDRDYGWARTIPRETVQAWTATAQQMTRDPIGFLNTFAAELRAHPVYGPQLLSTAGRTLASGGRAVALEPDVQIVDEHGRVTGMTFSAERVQAIVQQAVGEAIGREVQPLKSEAEQRRTEAKQAKADADARAYSQRLNTEADAAMARVTKMLEGRKDDHLWRQIDALMANGQNVYDAAWQVREQFITPGQAETARVAAVDTLKKKAAGNTANGAGTTVAAPVRPKNERELAKYLEALETGGRR